jgi:hypothetical protein
MQSRDWSASEQQTLGVARFDLLNAVHYAVWSPRFFLLAIVTLHLACCMLTVFDARTHSGAHGTARLTASFSTGVIAHQLSPACLLLFRCETDLHLC